QAEDAAYREAVAEIAGKHPSGTKFEYRYLPVAPAVCVNWEMVFKLGHWQEHAEVCGLVNMDSIDAMLPEEFQITPVSSVPGEVRASLRQAPEKFRKLLDTV